MVDQAFSGHLNDLENVSAFGREQTFFVEGFGWVLTSAFGQERPFDWYHSDRLLTTQSSHWDFCVKAAKGLLILTRQITLRMKFANWSTSFHHQRMNMADYSGNSRDHTSRFSWSSCWNLSSGNRPLANSFTFDATIHSVIRVIETIQINLY